TRGISRSDGRDQRSRRGRSTGKRDSSGLLRPLSDASHSTRVHPEPLMAHLIRRVRQREVSTSQLGLLARWLVTDPEVPEGLWFKRFPEMIVCGDGIGEDVPTAWAGSCRRRGDVIEPPISWRQFLVRMAADTAAAAARCFG